MIALGATGLWAAAIGCGVMAGIYFAFSAFVMSSLGAIAKPHGIAAMQSINVVVINRSFLGAFVGTALLSLGIAIMALTSWGSRSSVFFLAGAVSYFVGTFLVTGLGNVPQNNELAAVSPADASSAGVWERYLQRWTFLNTVRKKPTGYFHPT